MPSRPFISTRVAILYTTVLPPLAGSANEKEEGVAVQTPAVVAHVDTLYLAALPGYLAWHVRVIVVAVL
jgi:hypothetical protein